MVDINRLGIIEVTQAFILNGSVVDVLKGIEATPVRIIENFMHDTTSYVCISNKFEKVKEGEKIPEYEVNIKAIDKDGTCFHKYTIKSA